MHILWLEYIGVGRGASVIYNIAADNSTVGCLYYFSNDCW